MDLGENNSMNFRLKTTLQRKEHINVFTPLFFQVGENTANSFMKIRGKGTYLLYAEKDSMVKLTIRCHQVNNNKDNLYFVISSPMGDLLLEDMVLHEENKEVIFKAIETGVYNISCYAKANAFSIEGEKPLGLQLSKRAINLFSPSGDIYFWIPAGNPKIKIKVEGQRYREQVKAVLFNSKGEIIDTKDNISGHDPYYFIVDRGENIKGEMWCLRLEKASGAMLENVFITFILPTIPSISFSPLEMYVIE
jgi:hypothetical protein